MKAIHKTLTFQIVSKKSLQLVPHERRRHVSILRMMDGSHFWQRTKLLVVFPFIVCMPNPAARKEEIFTERFFIIYN